MTLNSSPGAEGSPAPLPTSFYLRQDVVQVAQELLGAVLVRETAEGMLRARIVETEAYDGHTDRACHAFGNRRTARTEVMFRPGGLAYVYFVYGLHTLLNVVTGPADWPCAVLIRGVEPLAGADHMLARRKLRRTPDGGLPRNLTAGPALLTQALGITLADNGWDLTLGQGLWLEAGQAIAPSDIVASPRVGVGYAGADALLPYRYRVRGNAWVSPAK